MSVRDHATVATRTSVLINNMLQMVTLATDRIGGRDHGFTARERFHVHLKKLGTGEHSLVIRVYDVAGNAGLAKTVLR